MKHKDLLITFAVLGTVIGVIGMIVGFFYMSNLTAQKDKAARLAYYKRDDCCITVIATMTRAEKINEHNYYRAYLQFDEEVEDFRFAEYYDILPSVVEELKKNKFNLTTFDKQYIFTIGRRGIDRERPSRPILAIREVDDDGQIYLDYETGISNLLSYLSS